MLNGGSDLLTTSWIWYIPLTNLWQIVPGSWLRTWKNSPQTSPTKGSSGYQLIAKDGIRVSQSQPSSQCKVRFWTCSCTLSILLKNHQIETEKRTKTIWMKSVSGMWVAYQHAILIDRLVLYLRMEIVMITSISVYRTKNCENISGFH